MDDDLIEAHLSYLRRLTGRKETIKHRRDNLRRLARKLPVPLIEATERHLDDWQDQLTVSRSSIQTYTGHVRAFYRWLDESGRRGDNPAAKLPMPRIPRRRPRPIAEDDLRLAFRCASQEMQLWLALAGWLGLRAGEISRLDDASVIDESEGMLLRIDGKGGKERILPVPAVMVPMIRAANRRGRWFRTTTGKAADANYVSRHSSVFFAGLGMPYTLHRCRHRFGTQHYAMSKDIRATQEAMGHSNPTTTALYVEVVESTAKRSIDRLSKSLPVNQHPAPEDEPHGRRRSA